MVSLVWAFSFGLIGHVLAGLPPALIACCRLTLSFAFFLPFWRPRRVSRRMALQLILVGSVQYGLMYITYISSFRFLPSHLVALYTVFTPLYVTLLHDARTRLLNARALLAALLAVAGAGVILLTAGNPWRNLEGFVLLQLSNLCFAGGQILYCQVMKGQSKRPSCDMEVFAWLYAGGVLMTLAPAILGTSWENLTVNLRQAGALLYLGVVASGGCFMLWNHGARQVPAGVLAVMNNVKIPLAVVVSLLVFGESTHLVRLCAGGGLVLAAWLLAAGRRRTCC